MDSTPNKVDFCRKIRIFFKGIYFEFTLKTFFKNFSAILAHAQYIVYFFELVSIMTAYDKILLNFP